MSSTNHAAPHYTVSPALCYFALPKYFPEHSTVTSNDYRQTAVQFKLLNARTPSHNFWTFSVNKPLFWKNTLCTLLIGLLNFISTCTAMHYKHNKEFFILNKLHCVLHLAYHLGPHVPMVQDPCLMFLKKYYEIHSNLFKYLQF